MTPAQATSTLSQTLPQAVLCLTRYFLVKRTQYIIKHEKSAPKKFNHYNIMENYYIETIHLFIVIFLNKQRSIHDRSAQFKQKAMDVIERAVLPSILTAVTYNSRLEKGRRPCIEAAIYALQASSFSFCSFPHYSSFLFLFYIVINCNYEVGD